MKNDDDKPVLRETFSKLAPDLKKQALPSAATTTRAAHEPSPSPR